MSPRAAAHQAPLSMRFSKQVAIAFFRGVTNPGVEPKSPEMQADSSWPEPPGQSKKGGKKQGKEVGTNQGGKTRTGSRWRRKLKSRRTEKRMRSRKAAEEGQGLKHSSLRLAALPAGDRLIAPFPPSCFSGCKVVLGLEKALSILGASVLPNP